MDLCTELHSTISESHHFQVALLNWSDCILMSNSDIFGFLVVLYENGTVSLSYLGTAPLIHNVNSAQESKMDYASIDEELKQLQSLIKNKSGKYYKYIDMRVLITPKAVDASADVSVVDIRVQANVEVTVLKLLYSAIISFKIQLRSPAST